MILTIGFMALKSEKMRCLALFQPTKKLYGVKKRYPHMWGLNIPT